MQIVNNTIDSSDSVVHVKYSTQADGVSYLKELPYVMGVLCDLSAQSDVDKTLLRDREFIEVSANNLPDIMLSIKPKVVFDVPNYVTGKGNLRCNLTFTSLQDFEPISVINQVGVMKDMLTVRTKLNDLLAKLNGNIELNKMLNETLLQKTRGKSAVRIVEECNMVKENAKKDYAKSLIEEFLRTVVDSKSKSEDAISSIKKHVAEIDSVLSLQLDEILHHHKFQKIEGSWRGLFMLITETKINSSISIRLLNVTKDELTQDFKSINRTSHSMLFKKVHEEEYGTFGGTPYSFLVSDFEFGRSNADLELLKQISKVSSLSLAPLIASVHPSLLDLNSFADLGKVLDVATIFESTELNKWTEFRETKDAQYVALTVPHVLARAPYGKDSNQVTGMNYEESVSEMDKSKFCWTSVSWFLAKTILESCYNYNWPTAIRGLESGGMIKELPCYSFKNSDNNSSLLCPTEVAITDRREKELSEQGFISLVYRKNSNYAAFFGAQTTYKPKNVNNEDSNPYAIAKLTHILAACRFGHYIKAIIRDRVGSIMSQSGIQEYINNWLAEYCLAQDDDTNEMQARFPLKSAKVEVIELMDNPDNYKIMAYINPHFQLEKLHSPIEIEIELPLLS